MTGGERVRHVDGSEGGVRIVLPDGRAARVQPLHVGDRGVLMAVEVDGGIKTDVRVRDDHMVVIDGGSFEDGKVVISVEPDYE